MNIASGLFVNNKAKEVPKMGTKGVDMMPTKWDVNPQITKNAEGFAQGRQVIANNLVGPSITSGVNKLYSSKLMGDSEAFGTKNNMETQMSSQKAQAMQRVEAIDNQNEMKQWQAQMAYDDNAGALGNFARAGVGQLGDTMVTMERDKNKQRTDMLIAALTASAFVPRYNEKEETGKPIETTETQQQATPSQQASWRPPQQSYGPNMPTEPTIPSAMDPSPAPENFYQQPKTGTPFAQQSAYDMKSAETAGMKPDENGKWGSRVPDGPNEGLILKYEDHPTFQATIDGEKEAGYTIFKNKKNGRLYSFKETPNEKEFELYVQQDSEEQQTPQINETKLAELMQQYPKPEGMNEEVYKAKLLQMNK
jgi:hypothetical protein